MWDDGGDDESDKGQDGCTRACANVWQCGKRIHGEVHLPPSLTKAKSNKHTHLS